MHKQKHTRFVGGWTILIAAYLALGPWNTVSLKGSRSRFETTAMAASNDNKNVGKAADFFLRPNDTVVFLGDSITALNNGTWPQGTTRPNFTYCVDIVSWVVTHRPDDRITFYDLGVPGDTAQGDIWHAGGPANLTVPPNQTIDQHLHYVEQLNPTVVTINLGMNDGEYVDCDPADKGYNETLYRAYTSGITHIVTALLAWSGTNSKPLRIVVLSPSYFDNDCRVAKGWKFSWGPPVAGYNQTLLAFGSWEKSYIARLHNPNVAFIDLNAPMMAASKKLPPGQSLTQEGIHPTEQGYEVIAATILNAWNARVDYKFIPPSRHTGLAKSVTYPWALYNGGTGYDICPALAQVSADPASSSKRSPVGGHAGPKYNQDTTEWENDVIGLIRDQFVLQQTSVTGNFTVPEWNAQNIYREVRLGVPNQQAL